MKEIFRYQIYQLLAAVVLVFAVKTIIATDLGFLGGSLWGVSTDTWLCWAIFIPILHQFYVWFFWRFELYRNTFTSRWGLERVFKPYAAGFLILVISRPVFVTLLAISNRFSLKINWIFAYILAMILLPVCIYLFYSIKKYFTFRRGLGIDHFDKNYREPFVKGGIFQYTNNGMYVFGATILYIPALLLLSKAALLAAIFQHIFVWAHYYCTELPDMKKIYGDTPK